MGVLVLLGKPTRGMVDEAAHAGIFDYEFSGARFPRIQIVTVADLLKGASVSMPTPIGWARKGKRHSGQMELLAEDD